MLAALHDVTEVQVLGHYRLRLTFSDGLVGDVDLSHLRSRSGVFESLRDPRVLCPGACRSGDRHDHLAQRSEPRAGSPLREGVGPSSGRFPSSGLSQPRRSVAKPAAA
jgi:hypothetical protein